MKLGLLVREKIIDEVKARVNDAQASIFVTFNKVGAFPLNTLRNDLKSANSKLFITKNSLFKRAFESLKLKEFSELVDVETGVVFVYDKDVVKTCKVLVDFSKENELLQLKGGMLEDKKLTIAQIKSMAKLPTKDILLAMAVRGIASPLGGFMTVLNQIVLKFVWALEEIKKTKKG